MTLVALVDTNVVVSGVLAGQGDSPNARILDTMIAGTLYFILSDELLAEYRAVLLRPAIVARHGLADTEVHTVLEGIVFNAGWREPGPAAPDSPTVPGDAHVVALLEAEPAAILVTGDRRLREAVSHWRSVLPPAELAALLGSATPGP